MHNEKTAAVREFIRQPFAFPGGYPIVLVMSDGWKAEGVLIHWEGAPECCDHCGAETESAYGDGE